MKTSTVSSRSLYEATNQRWSRFLHEATGHFCKSRWSVTLLDGCRRDHDQGEKHECVAHQVQSKIHQAVNRHARDSQHRTHARRVHKTRLCPQTPAHQTNHTHREPNAEG